MVEVLHLLFCSDIKQRKTTLNIVLKSNMLKGYLLLTEGDLGGRAALGYAEGDWASSDSSSFNLKER